MALYNHTIRISSKKDIALSHLAAGGTTTRIFAEDIDGPHHVGRKRFLVCSYAHLQPYLAYQAHPCVYEVLIGGNPTRLYMDCDLDVYTGDLSDAIVGELASPPSI
jgi:hypothetical protein